MYCKKKLFVLIIIIFSAAIAFCQQNKFFMELQHKELVTFNDAITLIRLLYDERDDNSSFYQNIIWAASKKLFRVTIPIEPEKINPIITRKEFAYWICKVFNIKGSFVRTKKLSRFAAYRICVNNNIINPGRGGYDSFNGNEILDSFSYLDYLVRKKNIRPREGELKLYIDDYATSPNWRIKLHREFDAQRAKEKQERIEKRRKRKEKLQKEHKIPSKTKKKQDISEKYIEDIE